MKFKMNQIYRGNIEKIIQQNILAVLYEGYSDDIKSKEKYESYIENMEKIGLDEVKLGKNSLQDEDTEIKSSLYKEGATLIKLNDETNLFVDVDSIRNESDILELENMIRKLKAKRESVVVGKFAMESEGFFEGELYVDPTSIERVYKNNSTKTLSLNQIKRRR